MSVPTAKEFLYSNGCGRKIQNKTHFFYDVTPEDLIEFAKLHVKEALKQAELESHKYISKTILELNLYNKESILNVYPLDKIK